MAAREKIVRLAQIVTNSKKQYTEEDPEYYGMACVVTDEQAEVAICMKRRTPTPLETLAKKSGKTLERTQELVDELCDIGVLETHMVDGKTMYWLPIFVPGIMENMVMNIKQAEAHPEIARAFERLSWVPVAPRAHLVPMGGAGTGMHVIPIEAAIPSGTKTASYEELSSWLKKYDRFSVGSCSCRVSRRLLGEGCGHLEKDMCIGVGDYAEYQIKTGKGRPVSYEEVLEILKKAEENGLMHQITNIDGPDSIFGICNCCRCSCFALRTSQYFNTPNMSRSNFVAKVDKEKCVACGQCVENCPANAAKLGQQLCTRVPIEAEKTILPDDHDWGEDRWNPNYRDSKENVVPTGTSPCKTACPAHIAVQGYIRLAAQGRYTDALELIKKENPFPAVCGRICPHGCESECTRGDLDEPIAIDEIKKFIADQELNGNVRFIPKKAHDYGRKMAVIGAGPAGLSCAYYLAVDGYHVTVFEKEEKLGGMLTLGIPSFRLEKNVVEAEIDVLRELGVEFCTGIEVGKGVTLDALRKQGFEAFYLAIGAQAGRRLGIEGEDAQGVVTGVAFLKDMNLGKDVRLTGKTVVIGGGNVAVDVARAAVRQGDGPVSMYCLESEREMPALPEEIEEATGEGIAIQNGWGPKRILVQDGRAVGVEFTKCVSVFDGEERFNPRYNEDETITVEAENVLLSIGQAVEWGALVDGTKVACNRNGTAVADELTYQTGEPDVFVGGDVYTGPKFAIDAIAAGKQAAISMHRFVWPGQSLTIGRDRRVYKALDKENLTMEGFDTMPRQRIGHTQEGGKSFRDPRRTFTEEQMKKETERCLGCGAAIVNQDICLGCGLCTTKCKFEAITLEKRFDAKIVPIEKLLITALPNIIKRKRNIRARKRREAKQGR